MDTVILENMGLLVTKNERDTVTITNKISGATVEIRESWGKLVVNKIYIPELIVVKTQE